MRALFGSIHLSEPTGVLYLAFCLSPRLKSQITWLKRGWWPLPYSGVDFPRRSWVVEKMSFSAINSKGKHVRLEIKENCHSFTLLPFSFRSQHTSFYALPGISMLLFFKTHFHRTCLFLFLLLLLWHSLFSTVLTCSSISFCMLPLILYLLFLLGLFLRDIFSLPSFLLSSSGQWRTGYQSLNYNPEEPPPPLLSSSSYRCFFRILFSLFSFFTPTLLHLHITSIDFLALLLVCVSWRVTKNPALVRLNLFPSQSSHFLWVVRFLFSSNH